MGKGTVSMTDETPKLSDVWPDKIMVQLPEDGKTHGVWHPVAKGWSVEYIRADLTPRFTRGELEEKVYLILFNHFEPTPERLLTPISYEIIDALIAAGLQVREG